MLVLTRKKNEEIVIGEDIRIKVCRITPSMVKLGIEAPESTRIERAEIGTPKDPESDGSH